jgi:hypothetical protein
MNKALSTWIDRSQRGSSSGSAKSGCRNTSRNRAAVSPRTVRPMRPTIAATKHQDRYQMEDDEAPLPVRLQAFAAQYAEAREEELDRNGENEQPGEPDEDLARRIHPHTSFPCFSRGRPGDRGTVGADR